MLVRLEVGADRKQVTIDSDGMMQMNDSDRKAVSVGVKLDLARTMKREVVESDTPDRADTVTEVLVPAEFEFGLVVQLELADVDDAAQGDVVKGAAIAPGKRAISECIALLKSSGLPFEFLAHLKGESKIVIEYSPNGGRSRWSWIAEALADEVGELD